MLRYQYNRKHYIFGSTKFVTDHFVCCCTANRKEPIMVSNQIKTDLSITIDNPDQLGKDLIVNAVTALNHTLPLL